MLASRKKLPEKCTTQHRDWMNLNTSAIHTNVDDTLVPPTRRSTVNLEGKYSPAKTKRLKRYTGASLVQDFEDNARRETKKITPRGHNPNK